MFQKKSNRSLCFVLLVLSQSAVDTYSLQIDPEKEVLSRDKKPSEKSHHKSKISLASEKEIKEVPAPTFLGDIPQKLRKLDEISEDVSIEKVGKKDDPAKKEPPKKEKASPPPTKEGIATKIKTFLGITPDAKKKNAASKDRDPKEESLQPKKKNNTDNAKSIKKDDTKREISLDAVDFSEEEKPVDKLPLSSYMKYFDIVETYKTLFNLHDFNINQDSSSVEPSSYLKHMYSIQSYTPVILNTDHHNEISQIINTKSTVKSDFEKIFIMAQYIKMIVKLTHQNLNVSDFLYKPTLLRFPQLAEHTKKVQTNSKFTSGKEFLYLNEKFDLYIKKNNKHKLQMDNKIQKKIQDGFSTSSSSKYLHDNLGLITYALFVPYISQDSTIKYFIFLTAVEMDNKQTIKSVYDIYLLPRKSYTFSMDNIQDHMMLQDLSDSLQKDLLKSQPILRLDPMFKRIIKKENDLMNTQPSRSSTNRDEERLSRDDITNVGQRKRQDTEPKKQTRTSLENYK